MRDKATHAGSCQACGRVQKLPGGVLSKHGYTVQWNCFNGVCRGTGELPYELSCTLIERFIQYADSQRNVIQLRVDKLNSPATEPKAWIHEYIGERNRPYQDREITLFLHDDGQFKTVFYFDHDGRRKLVLTHSIYAKDSLDAATELNQNYAQNHLLPQVKQLDQYIRWQQERVTSWKLTDLKPIDRVLDSTKVPLQPRA